MGLRLKIFPGILYCLFFIVFLLRTGNAVYANTSIYRSAGWVATDGIPAYTNTTGCQQSNDGLYCSRPMALSYANLYFSSLGNLSAFGIPQNAVITKVHMRIRGRNNVAQYVGVNSAQNYMPFLGQCEFPSDLWTFGLGATDSVWEFHTLLTVDNKLVNCITANNIDAQKLSFRINRAGIESWWADIDNFEVAFDYDPPPPSAPLKTPLIIIPGIGGSELKVNEQTNWSQDDGHGGVFAHNYPAGEKVWVNQLEAVKPGHDDYFDVLRMMPDGLISQANISLTGNLFSLYQDTVNFFVANGYTLNKDLFVFPYDWRKDNTLAAEQLGQKIDSIKAQTNADKVDILTHSMGGLIARKYISDPSHAQNVRKLFTLGAPYLGSVESLKSIIYGGCLTRLNLLAQLLCLGIPPSEVKDVLQNMISAYQLVPSKTYFSFYSNEDSLHPYPYRTEAGALNYVQIKNLLTLLDHNTSLFGPAETLHNLDDNLDNANGVEIVIIAGSGESTLGQIIEQKTTSLLGIQKVYRDTTMINGDGTVPLFSASLDSPSNNLSLLGSAKIYYTKQKHEDLVTNGPALNLVKNILEGSNQIPSGISSTAYNFNGTSLSVHSPVNIHVYDANGHHTGPTDDGDIEENIPGSSYDTLGDAKFIYVPEDGVYTIHFEATDNGSFDFKIRKFEDSVNTETALYKDIPLTADTKAQTSFDTSSNQFPVVEVDENGDGVVDFSMDRFSVIEGEENFDYTSPVVTVDVSPKHIWPPNGKMVDIAVTGTITDDHPCLTKIVVDDEYDKVEPSITTYGQDINETIQLEASRRDDDMDGRTYMIRIFATDVAGNTTLSTFDVVVPHDQRSER